MSQPAGRPAGRAAGVRRAAIGSCAGLACRARSRVLALDAPGIDPGDPPRCQPARALPCCRGCTPVAVPPPPRSRLFGSRRGNTLRCAEPRSAVFFFCLAPLCVLRAGRSPSRSANALRAEPAELASRRRPNCAPSGSRADRAPRPHAWIVRPVSAGWLAGGPVTAGRGRWRERALGQRVRARARACPFARARNRARGDPRARPRLRTSRRI